MSLNLEDEVVKNLERGYLCSESVIKCAADHLGMTWERLPAIATGLGGGIGGTAGVCGALTGAVLALGLAAGRNDPGQDFFGCAGLVQELVEQFKERFGSVNCLDILGHDIRTEEGRAQAMSKGLAGLACKDCCVFVAKYIAGNAIPSS